jgi:hypothetical protein
MLNTDSPNIYILSKPYQHTFINLSELQMMSFSVNRLEPNGHYSGRTAQLTLNLNIYSNTLTEYFKHVHRLHFFLFKMQFIS